MQHNRDGLKALIFDFDGVLVDSLDIKGAAFVKLFEDYGKEIQRKVLEYHHTHGGVSREEKIKYFYRELLKVPLSNAQLRGLCDRFSSLVVDEVVRAKAISGAEEFLKRSVRYLCFVVSATPQPEMQAILKARKWDKYFDGVFGSPASKVDNVRLILEKWGLRPSECIYFGDSESDYNTANLLKIKSIGIFNKNNPLTKYEGILLVRDFHDLLRCWE